MLRDKVGPGLRGMGFSGSGKRYSFGEGPSDDHALLGVQSDRYNDASVARFTLNVSFYSAEDWAETLTWRREHDLPQQAKPSPNEEYFCGWTSRVGFLYEPAHDHWWGVRNEADARLVAVDVIRVVSTFVVPHLTARLNHEQAPALPDRSDAPCGWALCPTSRGGPDY